MAEHQVLNGTTPSLDCTIACDRPVRTLIDFLQLRVRRNGNRPAFTFLGEHGDENSITFEELDARARAIAASIQRIAAPGDRVLLVYPPSLDFIPAFFGCVYAGVLAVPATYPKPRRPMHRLVAIADDCNAKLALSSSQTLNTLDLQRSTPELLRLHWLATDEIDDDAAVDWQQPDISGGHVAFLQYTSGSTSEPKGVMVSHGNVLHNLEVIRQGIAGRSPETDGTNHRGVFWLPAYHDMGLIGGILEPLHLQGHSILMPPATFLQRPIRWLKAMSDYRATISSAPNFAYELCVKKTTPQQRAGLDLSNWQVAFCGAEPIRAETLKRFTDAFSTSGFRAESFYPCYGLAESTLMAAGLNKPGRPIVKRVKRSDLAAHRVVSANGHNGEPVHEFVGCGSAWLDQQIVIADPVTRRRCGPDSVGEIWVKGPSVALGYWNQPDANRRTFNSELADTNETGYLRTGDLGFVSDGQLFVTGRVKDVIIIRGLNHYPQDIERTVEQAHPALHLGAGAACSVDLDGEEHLVVIHEIDRQFRDADLDEVIRSVRRAVAVQHELELYSVVLIRHASLPKTTSGKVQRSFCRERFLSGELKVLAEWRQEGNGRHEHNGNDRSSNGKPIRSPERKAPPNGAHARTRESNGAVASESRMKPSYRFSPPPFARPESPLSADEIDRLAEKLESWLSEWLIDRAEVPAEEIERDKPFAEYGLDSLTAVELSQELEDCLHVRLTPVVAWNYPTLETLARYLAREVGGANVNHAEVDEAADEMADNGFENLLAEIESLSDEEAEAALMRELGKDNE